MNKPRKVRLYINGKRQKDIYPEFSNWYVFKYKFSKIFPIAFFISLTIFLAIYTNLPFKTEIEKYCDLNVVECKDRKLPKTTDGELVGIVNGIEIIEIR
jgi:hypothetical protein